MDQEKGKGQGNDSHVKKMPIIRQRFLSGARDKKVRKSIIWRTWKEEK